MLLREVPAFSRVRLKDFGSIAEVDPDILVNGLDDVVPVWTHCERAENPFATVEVRGVVDHHLGLVWLPDDAQVEIVDGPRYAGQPETLAAAATPVQPPEGSKGTLKTPEGWPRLIWQSDLLFSPVQGWSDAELAVETLLCALAVAPATEPGLRPMLLAALKARYAKVVKDPATYPPSRYPWTGRCTPGENMLEYLRG